MGKSSKILTKTLFTRARLWDFNVLTGLLPNPDPVLRKKGIALEAYETLLADARVAACVESRKSGVLTWDWTLEGATDRNRRLVETHLRQLDMHRIIAEILDAAFFGYKPLEVIWSRINGKVLPAEIRGLPPQWFGFDTENQLRFKSMGSPINGELVPDRKVLLARRDASYANPYGRPLASLCFWPVTFKKGGLKYWISFAERFGTPYLIGKVPPGTPEDRMDMLAERLEAMVRDAVAVLEDDQTLETLDTTTRAASSDLYRQLIETMNAEIAVAILGQTLTTEVREGSRAAAQVHEIVREDLAARDRRMVAGVMNQLLQWVWALNFAGPAPQWKWQEEADPQTEWAQRDDLLAKQVRFTRAYFQRRYGLQEDEFEPLEGGASMAEPNPTKQVEFSDKNRQDAGQEAIDKMGDQFAGKAAKTLEPALGRVIDIVKNAKDYNEIMASLYDLHEEMDTTEFQELVRQALFTADLWGYYRARREVP